LILEGIVTTVDSHGTINIAPMGPDVGPEMDRFLLRPFRTSQTFQNLKTNGEGVLHVTDDVLLLAKAAIGGVEPLPALVRAKIIRGWILQDSCRYFEFRVKSMDESEERIRIEAEVVASERLRDFFGFNRAKHSVVEAAILATRTAFLPLDQIEAEYEKLAVLVEKTGGEQEHLAFALLQDHIAEVAQRRRTKEEAR